MKKFLLLIAIIAILSGCGTTNELTCTTDNTVGNITSSTKYVIDYQGNDITISAQELPKENHVIYHTCHDVSKHGNIILSFLLCHLFSHSI